MANPNAKADACLTTFPYRKLKERSYKGLDGVVRPLAPERGPASLGFGDADIFFELIEYLSMQFQEKAKKARGRNWTITWPINLDNLDFGQFHDRWFALEELSKSGIKVDQWLV